MPIPDKNVSFKPNFSQEIFLRKCSSSDACANNLAGTSYDGTVSCAWVRTRLFINSSPYAELLNVCALDYRSTDHVLYSQVRFKCREARPFSPYFLQKTRVVLLGAHEYFYPFIEKC